MKQLRVGLIGCGAIAEAVHVPSLASLPESFAITHCYDADSSLAERLAVRTGAESVKVDELLACVDVVGISSAPYVRARHLVAACRAGVRGVLVDVPVGLTAAEATFAISAAAGSATIVAANAVHSSDPAWQRAVRIVEPKVADVVLARFMAALGPDDPVLGAQTQLGDGPAFDPDAIYTTVASQAAVAGIGAPDETAELLRHLTSITIHDLPLVRSLFGVVEAVEHVAVFKGGVEVQLRTASGALAHLTAFRHALGRAVWRADLVAPDFHVSVEFPTPMLTSVPARVQGHDANGEVRYCNLEDNGYRAAWRAVHAAVANGAPVAYSLPEAAADHEIIERIARLAAGRRRAHGEEAASPANAVAVYGAGIFGGVHAGTAAARGTVVRVLSRSLRSAEARAALVGAEAAVFNAPHALDGIGAVVVAGVPTTHAAHALSALAKRVPVLVEKPMTATVAEARSLAAEVARTGVRFVYGENWAFRPAVLKAVELARDLELAEIEVKASWMTPPWGDYLDPSHGGGVLFDAGAHAIELARMLLGRPAAESVSAQLQAGPTGADIDSSLSIEFADGRRARIHVAWGTSPHRVTATGRAFAFELSPNLTLTVEGSEVALPSTPGLAAFLINDGIVGEHEALTGDGPVVAGAEDGLAVMEITAAAYLSARTGEPEPLPFADDERLTPHELWTRSSL